MVETEPANEKWITDPSGPAVSVRHSDSCRRIGYSWGVHSQVVSKAGYWAEKERLSSINVRELTAINYALLLHVRNLKVTEIQLYTDNTTALKYVIKSGGTASAILQDLDVQVQDLCNLHKLRVQYHHVAGIKNTKADQLSRLNQPLHKSSIPKAFFKHLKKRWGRKWQIDAFAAAHNHQLPRYWSLLYQINTNLYIHI